jgi:PAS domain S-box-containing protein
VRRTAGLGASLRSFAIAALTFAVAFSVARFTFVQWNLWTMLSASTDVATSEMRLSELSGTILQLDEVLTMSARMAAATADPQWETRYRRFEPKLDQAIREAVTLFPEVYANAAVHRTRTANTALVTMENEAFRLVREGRRGAATALLSSAEYQRQKESFAAGLRKSAVVADRRIRDRLSSYRDRTRDVLLVAAASQLVLLAAWIAVVLLVRRHLAERRRAGEALRESERRLRAVVTNAPVVLFTVDRAGIFTFSDGKGLETLGMAGGRMVGRTVARVLRNRPEELEYFRRALAGEPVEWLGVFAELRFECRLTPVRDERGEIAGIIGVAIDVSERVRAEETHLALERSLLETQKLESLGVLAGGIAHDFNNLLTGVVGHTSLARLDLPPTSPAQARLEQIEVATRRAADLTAQLLAYAGRGRFVTERLDLNRVVEEMGDLLRVSITKGATLRYDLGRRLPMVDADPTQIRQVVMNLVINAAEAIGSGTGTVTVATRTVDLSSAGHAATSAAPDLPVGRYVAVEVTDTGCGMDAVTLSRIFEPFFTTKFAGRGLGLAAAQGIIRAHGGALRVKSDPGRGTAFTVLLPRAAERAEPALLPPAPPVGGGIGATVLVIDDEEDVRAVTAHMLERLGCTAVLAGTGHEGLSIFRGRTAEIDTVLLDMTMPDASGRDVFRALREVRPDARVVLMSGYSESETTEGLAEAGLVGFLHKPFRLTDLARLIGAGPGKVAPPRRATA